MSRPFKSQNMMTEHLQSIRDLDLELELLKRKRELMEQQHQITNIRQGQYDYNQPERYHEQRSNRGAQGGSDRSYANLYENPSQSNYRDRPKPSAKKRQGYNSHNEWNETPPPKRSFGPPKGKFWGGANTKPAKKFNPMDQSMSSPMPLMQISSQISPNQRQSNQRPRQRPNKQGRDFGQGPASNKPNKPFIGQRIMETKQTPKKEFTPNKVNKLKKNSAPFPHKDKLVEVALKLHREQEEQPILLPDKVPTQQMAGRLELALGKIMKDIKESYEGMATYANSFTPIGQRSMKQAIRERLRGVMLGKPVGHLGDIISFYRNTYPRETDVEIVKIGANKPLNEKQEAIKVAGDYFKKNIYKLLHGRLDYMFEKIQKIYKEERAALKEKALKEKLIEDEKTDSNEQSEANAQSESNVEAEPNAQSDSNEEKVPDEQAVAEEQPATNEHETTDVDAQDTSEKQDTNEKQVSEGQEVIEVKDTNEDIESTKITENNDVTTETVEIKDDGDDTERDPKEVEDAKKLLGFDVYQLYDKLMNTFLSERLPKILPKYKPVLLKTLDIDLLYETKKIAIMKETKRIIQQGYGVSPDSHNKSKSHKTISADDDDSHREKPRPAYAPLPYYVKIIGTPALPKRHKMQGFLDQFHPKSIKKVKSLRNLLFVGFENKEDFDGVVAATGAVIGNDTLTVKISKWVTSLNKNEDADETNESINEASKNESVISSDLDNQISDLLSCIRSDDEKNGVAEKEEEANETGLKDETNNDEEKNDTQESEAVKGETANEEDVEEVANGEGVEEVANGEGVEEVANEEGGEEAGDDSQKQDNTEELKEEEKDKLGGKEAAATPTRASTRLASGAVRTRRASRLAQN